MVTLSIDGNFGPCRKKAAGTSVHDPLTGHLMFCDQAEVDEFVGSYNATNSEMTTVSN